MGYRPIVHCRQCGDALDVFVPRSKRFCCSGCEEEFRWHNPGVVEKDEAAEERVARQGAYEGLTRSGEVDPPVTRDWHPAGGPSLSFYETYQPIGKGTYWRSNSGARVLKNEPQGTM